MENIQISRWSSHPYFFINGDLDFRVIKALEYELSYFVEGYEKTKKFKEGRWNGQECLLYKSKKGTRFFPAGLLGTVSRVLSDFEVDYLVQDIKLSDVRKKYKPLDLTWTGPELRDYQKKAVLDIMNKEGGTVCLPTGSGKTVVMLRIAYEYNLPFIVVVHTKELLYQWEKNIKTYFNGRCPGLVGDGYYNIEPITIAMMQTLSQKIVSEKIENLNFPIFVADECHRVPAETMYAVSMRCNAPVRIGLSATPTRTDGAQLKIFAACGEIRSKITPDELIKAGVLAKPKFEFLTPSGMYIPRGTKYFDAYLSGIVLNESRNNLIVKKALEYVAQHHTVYIHVERIDHGELLQGRIPGSVFLSGKDGATKRQGVLRKFSKGEIPVLVSTLLKEGVDIPTISVFIAAGAGKSEIAVIQKAGRALRVAPGKTEAVIVDFRDSGRYLADHWAERYNTYKSVFGDYVPDV